MRNKSRLYEGMYVLNATLSEDARHKALQKIFSTQENQSCPIFRT